jgi:hypothetical protein
MITMDDDLNTTLNQLETEVMETLDNPYSTYLVQFPYTVSYSFPDDDHHTSITIESTSQVLRYGRNSHDMELQTQLDQEHSRHTFSKHLMKWVSSRMSEIDPREATVTYGDDIKIDLMTDDQIDEFREGCLNDE